VAHLAADHGVRVMALTDHDSFYGVILARAAAHRRGLGYVTGVEVSTYPPLEVRHILGHGVDRDHPRLLTLLRRNQRVLRMQTEAWIRVLRDQGLAHGLGLDAFDHKPVPMPGAVLKLALQHHVMSAAEASTSVRRAVDFMPAEVYAPMPTPKAAVDAIHAAGGLAVLAHPGVVPDQDLMREALPLVDGLEVYTRRHTPEQIPIYEELARRYGLFATVGSDYHGFNGEPYQVPKQVIDQRYLERLGSRIEWPALAATA